VHSDLSGECHLYQSLNIEETICSSRCKSLLDWKGFKPYPFRP
jgi:hypothetical protein